MKKMICIFTLFIMGNSRCALGYEDLFILLANLVEKGCLGSWANNRQMAQLFIGDALSLCEPLQKIDFNSGLKQKLQLFSPVKRVEYAQLCIKCMKNLKLKK